MADQVTQAEYDAVQDNRGNADAGPNIALNTSIANVKIRIDKHFGKYFDHLSQTKSDLVFETLYYMKVMH